MTVAPVALTPAAVRDALQRRGMNPVRAEAAARGLTPATVVLDALDQEARDRVALAAQEQGIAYLTGDGWVLVSAPAAQLAGLVRPARGVFDGPLAEELGRTLRGLTEPPTVWETARGDIALDRPVVVGILNITPDSFSDGGTYLEPAAALHHAESMVAAGADMLDIGAESTRPGLPDPVPADEEWRRLARVLPELVRRFPETPLSIDTVKAETARRALDAGAWAVNDVSGLRLDPGIGEVCAAHGAGLILMHSRGALSEIASYLHAAYDDVVADVVRELRAALRVADERDVPAARIVVDPGLGFGKLPEHNYAVLRGLSAFASLPHPVMVGPSRKRFLGAVTGNGPGERDNATAAACVAAYGAGAQLFRVHAVAQVREALDVAAAIRSA